MRKICLILFLSLLSSFAQATSGFTFFEEHHQTSHAVTHMDSHQAHHSDCDDCGTSQETLSNLSVNCHVGSHCCVGLGLIAAKPFYISPSETSHFYSSNLPAFAASQMVGAIYKPPRA